VVKVFLQEELGRHTILTGDTTLEALNRVPGPAWRLSWAGWCWPLLLVGATVALGGVLAAIVQALRLLNVQGPDWLLASIVSVGTAAVLIAGRYKFIETTAGVLVAGFTAMTVVALVLLQRTEFRISADAILHGLQFRMPERGLADAVAVFGVTGIGTAELLFYPYWCLEKGYARDLRKGWPRDPEVVRRRISGMRTDIAIALAIYTFATLAFFILGATILHGTQQVPSGIDLVRTLSQMYTRTFGEWVFYVFAVGAFFVLFSTFFVAMATWARLCADTARLVLPSGSTLNTRRLTNRIIVVLAGVYLLLCVCFSRIPHWLIVGGAVVQTLLLPVFGLAVLLIRGKREDPCRPGIWFDIALGLSMLVITAAAAYSVAETLF
ncbi:MAG: Nramp family divalent metal transporter, partial [Verrucomicrobiae bacterium]|nr:Nramp family divalent metal transporter [Verrucomicrobiae bacterium]